MGITVKLCHNSSPAEKISKTLDAGESFDCVLKADTSILKPTLVIHTDSSSIPGYNYMYISNFGRYYFIDDIVSKNNNIWEVSGHVDVLETYATQIKANSAVVKRQQGLYNLYLDDPEFKTYNNEKIQTLKFPVNNFNKSLHYVMVVNGS